MQLLNTPKLQPFRRNHLIRDAINRAIYEAMVRDPSIYVMGEGQWVKKWYDARYIWDEFPERVITLPIAEDSAVNFAVGMSLLGVKPVVDLIAGDFLFRAMDSVCNTAAKLNFVRPDQQPRTIVIQAEFLLAGPTTGQRIESMFTHIPGLNVVIPSTPRDAHSLMLGALATPGVTLFFEDREIQDELITEPDQRIGGRLGLGYALLRRNGNAKPDATVVTYGIMRQVVEQALDPMLNIDLIDLRSIFPIDWMEIKASVRRSGKLVIIEPDVQWNGVGAEIIAQISEALPHVRVKRLGAKRETIPAAARLHKHCLPSDEEILHAITDW